MSRTEHDTTRTPESSAADDRLETPQDAAQWFARLQSGDVTDQDRAGFAAWRAAHPDHERAYRRLSTLWQASRHIPEARLRALMRETPPVALTRRRQWLTAAGVCSVLAVAGVVGMSHRSAGAVETLSLTTRKGERRQAQLPDGSVLHLNSDTSAVVCYRQDERHVALYRGEVYFDVRHDASRPFVVDGGLGWVSVLGTRFNVRRDAEALQVSVEAGDVRVHSGTWWRRSERQLTAGQQIVAYPDESLSTVARVDVANVVAWQRGKVIFNDAPLASVILEMNRYLPAPAHLAQAELGRYRISGVFSVDDPDALMAALPAIAPVRVDRLADGRTTITSRDAVTK